MDNEKKYMTIDGIQVEINGEKNVLEVIRKAGIDMPTLCYQPCLSIYGSCRMCMYENERGGLEAACSSPAKAGMSIKTNTAKLRKYRKNILELLLANHNRECTTCGKNGHCKLQSLAFKYGVKDIRFDNKKVEPIIDDSSLCIVRDESKCILCGACVRMCKEIQGLGVIDFTKRGSKAMIGTSFYAKLATTDCVGCGQCDKVCPTGAITIKKDTQKVWNAIEDPNTYVTCQIAPAVRVAIGQELGIKDGKDVLGKIVTALHMMGVNKVYDTSVSADLTVLEETNEFLGHIGNKDGMPLFTSCCPGWIQFAERKYPEILPHISTCKSPMQMLSALIQKTEQTEGKNLFNFAVMPCTAKKYEVARDEFKHDGKADTDVSITTQEFIEMVNEMGIRFQDLKPTNPDSLYSNFSGAGLIFGVTGGVTEAVLRRVSDADCEVLANVGQRGLNGTKLFTVKHNGTDLNIAVVSGLANTGALIEKILAKEIKLDFVEVMACPGGCVNGGGQPVVFDCDLTQTRSEGLYQTDSKLSLRRAQDNKLMDELYDEVIKGETHELLHVSYLKK